jgi:hypothetical protein
MLLDVRTYTYRPDTINKGLQGRRRNCLCRLSSPMIGEKMALDYRSVSVAATIPEK